MTNEDPSRKCCRVAPKALAKLRGRLHAYQNAALYFQCSQECLGKDPASQAAAFGWE